MSADIFPMDSPASPDGPDIVTFFEELLQPGISLRIRVTGGSMSPFLRGGEILTIQKGSPDTLRKGDLIFFKTKEHFSVIHRIVEKKRREDDTYLFRTKGDAVSVMDEPVREHEIIGKVCKIERTSPDYRGKQVDMENPVWKVMNFSLALVSAGKGKVASYPALAGLLRRIKKAFV